jgi:hypothetical protein
MVLTANQAQRKKEEADPPWVNKVAGKVLDRFPQTEVLATTSGRDNVRRLVNRCDKDLIKIIMQVYEPDSWIPDGLQDMKNAWNRRDREACHRITREEMKRCGDLVRSAGFQYWLKPTGQATPDKGARAGQLDYAEIARMCDGQNIQTQASCARGKLREVADWIVDIYQREGIAGRKGLFLQTSTTGSGSSQITAERAFACAQTSWARHPIVTRHTLWWAAKKPGAAKRFLEMRRRALG